MIQYYVGLFVLFYSFCVSCVKSNTRSQFDCRIPESIPNLMALCNNTYYSIVKWSNSTPLKLGILIALVINLYI